MLEQSLNFLSNIQKFEIYKFLTFHDSQLLSDKQHMTILYRKYYWACKILVDTDTCPESSQRFQQDRTHLTNKIRLTVLGELQKMQLKLNNYEYLNHMASSNNKCECRGGVFDVVQFHKTLLSSS